MAQRSLRTILRAALPGLLISACATAWCRSIVGPNLGSFLGAILLLTFYTPAIALAAEPRGRWIAAACTAIGASIVLACSARSLDVTAAEMLRCFLVLLAYAFALAGLAGALAWARIPATLAAGVTLTIGFAWLTWPVWLSPWMTQPLADWLTPANPLLALNSVVQQLGTWDRAPIAYRALTVLNQDVPYHLPTSIVPAVLVHLGIGIAGLAASASRESPKDE